DTMTPKRWFVADLRVRAVLVDEGIHAMLGWSTPRWGAATHASPRNPVRRSRYRIGAHPVRGPGTQNLRRTRGRDPLAQGRRRLRHASSRRCDAPAGRWDPRRPTRGA